MTNPSHPDSDRWRELAPADPGSDPTRDFWGDAADWPSEPTDELAVDAPRTGLGATIGRWWNSTGSQATRTHATSSHARPETQQRPDPIAAADVPDPQPGSDEANAEGWDDGWEPAQRPRPGVDPLLARIGGAAVVLTLLVPVVMGFTSSSDDAGTVQTADAPIAPAAGPAPDSAVDDATVTAAVPNITPSPTVATAAAADQTPAPGDTEPSDPMIAAEPSIETTVAPSVEALVVAPCGDEYEIAVGDFWIRIANGAGVEIGDLLAVNDATSDTPLYPGRTICLPVGANTPPPPPTTPSTEAPTASTNNSSSGSTHRSTSPTPTAPRTTTAPPTTAAPPAPPAAWSASADQVQSIIRDVWPDELEDRALEIAWRESNYRPTAKNNCCYGVFQIYWSVHRSWLADLGITSAEQLFDPTLNARAALTLYQRAGGWGPWGG